MTKLLFAAAISLLCCVALVAQCNDDCAFIEHLIASGNARFAKPLWSFGGRCSTNLEGVFNCEVRGPRETLKPEYDRLVSALHAALGKGWTIADANPSHTNRIGYPYFSTEAKLSNSERELDVYVNSVDEEGTTFLTLVYKNGMVAPPPGYPSDKKLSPKFRNIARTTFDCIVTFQEHLGKAGFLCEDEFVMVEMARLNDADAYMERLLHHYFDSLARYMLEVGLQQGQAREEAYKRAIDNSKDCREEALAGLNAGILGPQTTCTTKPIPQ